MKRERGGGVGREGVYGSPKKKNPKKILVTKASEISLFFFFEKLAVFFFFHMANGSYFTLFLPL